MANSAEFYLYTNEDDWCAFYAEDVLVDQGHSLDWWYIIQRGTFDTGCYPQTFRTKVIDFEKIGHAPEDRLDLEEML